MKITVRNILVSMSVAGALALTACGSKSNESDATNMTEVNGAELEGTTNDMTVVDSATGETTNLANEAGDMNSSDAAVANTADNAM